VQWRHLDPDWEKEEIPHIGLPDILIKGHGRGKYKGVEQHTFLTPEAKRDLLEYREWLERVKGVKFAPEDNIFLVIERPFRPITTDILSNTNTRLSEYSGIEFSWHDARRYVETALEEIKIHPNWARKIRGRKVRGEESPYSRPAIEQLREEYRKAVPLLEFTQPTQLMELQRRQQIVEQITSKIMAGEPLTEEERANMKRYNILLRERAKRRFEDCPDGVHCDEDDRTDPSGIKFKLNSGSVFEQIPENLLLEYLRNGWTVEHKLANGEVIVKKS
jgi:hypothetical protein